MKRLLVLTFAAAAVAGVAVPAAAVLEPCKTTAGDAWARVECDQVCENVSTCVADGKRVCNGTCIGGPNDGNQCDSDADCPDVSNVCIGGPNDGMSCTKNSQCPDEVEKRCGGGPSNPNFEELCEEDVDCQFEHFTCAGGANEDQPCVNDAECPNSRCRRDPDSDPGCQTIVLEDARCGVNAKCGERQTGDPVLCAIGVDLVKGSGQNDVIYVGDGDVRVMGRGGNDRILKGSNSPIRYLNGPALNPANTGRLVADGGNGNDTIGNASPSDGDILFGGPGNDTLVGCGGRNVLVGEGGDDTLMGWAFCNIDDGPLGSIYCGGDGIDSLFGYGTGHQCMDGGRDQAGSSDCQYLHVVSGGASPDAADIGTAVNCASPDAGLAPEPCGCDLTFDDVALPLQ